MRTFARTLVVLTFPLALAAADRARGDDDQVRATFWTFVAAQNAHDLTAVEQLLLDSPDFLWITRGTAIWGRDRALARFRELYAGTWHLDPDSSALRVLPVRDGVAQLFVPMQFTIGPKGQPPQVSRFLFNQVLVRTDAGWRISSILPIPLPPPGP